jgi:hypothetical protein
MILNYSLLPEAAVAEVILAAAMEAAEVEALEA